jgi:predicted alpha/beta hydrolase
MSSRPHLERLRQPEAITVTSFDGTPILYDLYDVPSRTLVLIVPGFWRDRRHISMVRLANWLASGGYRTAICDLRGHGESGGVFGFNLNEHNDVAAVANDLIERWSLRESIRSRFIATSGSRRRCGVRDSIGTSSARRSCARSMTSKASAFRSRSCT